MSSAPPRRNSAHRHRPKNSTVSISNLKKKVRDLDRLLSRNSKLTADARVENERALEAFKHELALATISKTEQKMAKKYHMVRFFERQKATRKLKKIEREVKANQDTHMPEDLQRRLHSAEVELKYTLHYPRGEKYISLFKDPGNNPKVKEKRDAIKEDIARRMASGKLGAVTTAEDEGVDEDDSDESRQPVKETRARQEKKPKGKKGKRKEEAIQGAGDIKDDDFFEF